MNIRSTVFWMLDAMRGGNVKRELAQVRADMQDPRPLTDRLTAILEYAIKNVPHYRDIASADIRSFPVMNKSAYLADYEGFQSTEFAGQEMYTYYTSGSSGTPFHGVQDREKRNKHTADFLYFMGKCGWNLGEKYIFLRAWTHQRNNTLHNLKNNVVTFDVLNFNEKMMQEAAGLLERDQSIKMLLGYGSALNQFAVHLEKNNIFTNGLRVVISDSDALEPNKRFLLKKHLNCRVVDRYSNEENGLIGFSFDVGEPFQINCSSYFVELLKLDSDEYAEKGEVGRIVITDLYNRAMPLIRYELGDLAVSEDESRCGVVTLGSLQGRLSDMVVQKSGTRIGPTVICSRMHSMEGIEQFQLVQHGICDFTLYVVEKTPKYTDEDFFNSLKSCIGSDSKLEVVRTDHIQSEKNGKYKMIVCNIEKGLR